MTRVRIGAWLAVLGLATAALAAAPAAGEVLVYDRSRILAGELWRLYTGHLIHFSAAHLAANLVALGAAAYWLRRDPGLPWLLTVLPWGIGLGLLALEPELARFGGLSGVVSAALVYLALTGLHQSPRGPWLLLLGALVVKNAAEQSVGGSVWLRLDVAAVYTVPWSHTLGLIGGAGLWALCTVGRRRLPLHGLAAGAAAAALLPLGCATSHHQSASWADLMQTAALRQAEAGAVPARVALALAPGVRTSPGLIAAEEPHEAWLRALRDRFAASGTFAHVELLPRDALTAAGGGASLAALSRRHGVDAVWLVGFDQVQHADQSALGFLYWTGLGAYLVPGERLQTQTVIDAALVRASAQLALSVRGTSEVRGRATLLNRDRRLRDQRAQGFDAASRDLVERATRALAAAP